MTEEERKSYEILYEKIIFVDKYRMLKPHWIKFHNYIEKLQKENEELRNTKKCCPQFNTSGIKCKNKDIHCPTSKETLDYYENFLIPGYEEEIKKLKKENEELKNKVVKRDNEIIQLEESAEKEFLTKQEVKENYIPKDKIREKLEKIEKEKEQYYAAGQHLMYMLLKNQLKSLLEEE